MWSAIDSRVTAVGYQNVSFHDPTNFCLAGRSSVPFSPPFIRVKSFFSENAETGEDVLLFNCSFHGMIVKCRYLSLWVAFYFLLVNCLGS